MYHVRVRLKYVFSIFQAEFFEAKPLIGVRASLRSKSISEGIKYSAAELIKKEILLEVIGIEIKHPYKGLQVNTFMHVCEYLTVCHKPQ